MAWVTACWVVAFRATVRLAAGSAPSPHQDAVHAAAPSAVIPARIALGASGAPSSWSSSSWHTPA